MTDMITPNAPEGTANDASAVPSFDSIAAKMDAMKAMTLRNQIRATEDAATGEEEQAVTESPVAPEGSDAQPEVAELETEDIDGTDEADAQAEEPVSTDEAESTAEELIDFIEFAEENPNAKFKFMRNGKEVVIDAKKAAAILGQGGAIHEEARQLKIERAEFEEFLEENRARQEGLTLAMEFTVQPQLQHAYDEIVKTQNYQATFQQQLAQTTDPAQQTRIRASMAQNERYIAQQSEVINQLKPAVDTFYDIRRQQVAETLEKNRKNFTDKELKNEYVFNEIREKVSKIWAGANNELLPGIKNIDLVSSDEHLLALVRDGLKYRSKPSTKSAGSSIATLSGRKAANPGKGSSDSDLNTLREQAKGRGKEAIRAADNLLVAQLSKLRAARGSR